MRGFKRSIADTEAAYASGKLIDSQKRSFVSQPKIIAGECSEPKPHLILWGADKTAARMALFIRENMRCQACKRVLSWGGEGHEDEYAGEWMHLRDKDGEKCDCSQNAALMCHNCHQGPGTEHYKRRPRFGPEHDVKLMEG